MRDFKRSAILFMLFTICTSSCIGMTIQGPGDTGADPPIGVETKKPPCIIIEGPRVLGIAVILDFNVTPELVQDSVEGYGDLHHRDPTGKQIAGIIAGLHSLAISSNPVPPSFFPDISAIDRFITTKEYRQLLSWKAELCVDKNGTALSGRVFDVRKKDGFSPLPSQTLFVGGQGFGDMSISLPSNKYLEVDWHRDSRLGRELVPTARFLSGGNVPFIYTDIRYRLHPSGATDVTFSGSMVPDHFGYISILSKGDDLLKWRQVLTELARFIYDVGNGKEAPSGNNSPFTITRGP